MQLVYRLRRLLKLLPLAKMPHMDTRSPTPRRKRTQGAPDVASLTGRAFIDIRKLLLRGEFALGERISEVPLAARLRMSRTPIRLALERLAHLGLLDVGETGGFLVRQFTIDEVRDAIELRGVLEGTAARFAAERLVDNSELDVLRRCRDDLDRHSVLSIESFSEYLDLNEQFHAAIADLAKSEMLRRLLDQANSLPFASPSAMVFPTSMLTASKTKFEHAQEQHHGIVEAIQNREGTRAEHLAREHARLAWRVFQLALSDEDVMSHVPGEALIDLSTG